MARTTTKKKKGRVARKSRPAPSLVPKPPTPAAVSRKRTKRAGLSKKARDKISELKEELGKKQYKASHVMASVGGAAGCTAAAAIIIEQGWMRAKWATLLMSGVGAGAAYYGWHQQMPHVMWAGSGCAAVGSSLFAISALNEAKAKKRAKQRNAMDSEPGQMVSEMGQRMRLAEERTRELEQELARARQRLKPEHELAAA